MSDTYIIEVKAQAAGIVVRNPGGYRFFAASHRFNALDARFDNLDLRLETMIEEMRRFFDRYEQIDVEQQT